MSITEAENLLGVKAKLSTGTYSVCFRQKLFQARKERRVAQSHTLR